MAKRGFIASEGDREATVKWLARMIGQAWGDMLAPWSPPMADPESGRYAFGKKRGRRKKKSANPLLPRRMDGRRWKNLPGPDGQAVTLTNVSDAQDGGKYVHMEKDGTVFRRWIPKAVWEDAEAGGPLGEEARTWLDGERRWLDSGADPLDCPAPPGKALKGTIQWRAERLAKAMAGAEGECSGATNPPGATIEESTPGVPGDGKTGAEMPKPGATTGNGPGADRPAERPVRIRRAVGVRGTDLGL